MRLSVFTASTPDWTPEEAVAELSAQGWHGMEWRVTDQSPAEPPGFWAGNRATIPLTGLEGQLDRLAGIMREAGLAFSGIGGYVRCDDRENVERMLAATARLGAERVRVVVPSTGSGDYRAAFAAARRDFEWVADRAAAHGVTALVELHHGTLTSSASAALRLIDGLDPAHVGVIHDLGNLLIEGQEDYASAFELLGPYLAHVHVKNSIWRAGAPDADGVVAWTPEWAPLRLGIADVEGHLSALVAHGYDGWVTVEDFSTALPLVERTADNLLYLRTVLARVGATLPA